MRLALNLAVVASLVLPSAVASEGTSTATVCATFLDLGHGCATGSLGSLPVTDCAEDGCRVTFFVRLDVVPVACGYVRMGGVHVCALNPTAGVRSGYHEEPSPARFAPGTYEVETDLCLTDPTASVLAPCERLVHTFVVPSPDEARLAAILTDLLGALVDEGRRLVHDAGSYRVFAPTDLVIE